MFSFLTFIVLFITYSRMDVGSRFQQGKAVLHMTFSGMGFVKETVDNLPHAPKIYRRQMLSEVHDPLSCS